MTSNNEGALAGVRVVDLSRVYAGPFCTQTLADHGADVVKIEPPQGDETRDWGPAMPGGISSYYWGLNRNKRNLALDLSHPDGRDVLFRLLETADVLVDNFKQGTLERWGIGYEDCLRERFPRLVHCSISGYGADGPLARFPGYDAVAQGLAGFMSINGEPGGMPLKVPFPVVDFAAGLSAVSSILLALVERARSGLGQHVDIDLFSTALSMLHPVSTSWMATGDVPVATGNVYGAIAPYGVYPCKDKPVATGAGNNRTFARLVEALGVPELARDPRFATNAQRVAHRDALDTLLGQLTAELRADDVVERLLHAGVATGPVNTIADAFGHPQAARNAMFVNTDAYTGAGIPAKLSRTPGSIRRPPRPFAADTDAVLDAFGIDAARRDALRQAGVIHDERAGSAGSAS
ncbi:CoA transferase [Burkholderia ambifaria]|uniref:CaiB/BaiF CoA transferase family protein n=1 Tax=Burkholderia ambifaria TaxID=152480 RepID=UPI001E5F3F29|nr:CoA transferase [Burkholderia ambifaria]UEP51230.1 CoA transferase [Burkholderia ambifaria]